jgi:TDG/mug DNA glycosylase family protein
VTITKATGRPDGNALNPRPTAEQMAAAPGLTLPDLIGPGLRVLFCGINPGLSSAAVGLHFARPGNRFWPALYASGFTPELFPPGRQKELVGLGLGISSVVQRATARADELTAEEARAGGLELVAKVEKYQPRWVAILGITVYREAFGRKHATIGRQPDLLGGSRLWVLPNPSGLNAHWSAQSLAEEFGRLHAAVDTPDA